MLDEERSREAEILTEGSHGNAESFKLVSATVSGLYRRRDVVAFFKGRFFSVGLFRLHWLF